MSSSLSSLFRHNTQRARCRTLSFGLLALLFVSALFLFVTPKTSADSPVPGKGDSDNPLYATAERAALAEAIAEVDSRSDAADSLAFTPCMDGMADIYPCDQVDLLAFMPLDEIGGSNTNDIWGWTDPQNGKEYALVGRTNGSSFVDITDPENPVYLGNLPGYNGSSSNWRDIKVYQDHAFIVSEAAGHGMQIFDLTQLRNVTNPPVTFTEDAHYDGFGSAHNIVINEESGYAYAVGANTCNAGLDMLNISSPLNPTAVGCFSDDGYTHDAQCVNYEGADADYANSEICFNANEDTLTIVDVTDKDNPVQLAREGYDGASYSHQGWLTEDHKYFLLGDELDETSNGHNTYTYIWNVEDLDAPDLIGIYDSGLSSSDHNLYTKGNFVYESNYASGLRILKLDDIANGNLELAGYFDVFPANNNVGFDGSWSNYPYFASGSIIVTSRTLGFMIVRANLAADFSLSSSPSKLAVCVPNDALYTVEVGSSEGFSEVVNLSVSGEPAGAGVDFSMNDMAPPFSSTLTISTTNATAGSYHISIIGTATNTQTSTVGLNLASMALGDVTLMSPADGMSDVSRRPTFEWMAADQAASYHLEVATEMTFTDTDVVIDVMLEESSYEVEMSLDVLTTYYWRVTAMNACGAGNMSDIWSFTTEDAPPILVVDDQNGDSAVLSYWTDALDALGEEYDLFDTTINAGDPDAKTMAPYDVVIHFTGYDWDESAGPDGDEAAAYLDMGTADAQKCLFISSQDYLWGQGGGGDDIPTPFMMDYLGVSEGQSDVVHTTAQGAAPFALLGPYTLDFPFANNYSDRLEPDNTASVAFVGDAGNAAVSKVAEGYRTTWWGFPYEAIPSPSEREEALQTVLDWCAGIEIETGTLAGRVTDADSGDPIEGATVAADNGRMTTTDAQGDYSMILAPGTYTVTAEADHYLSSPAEGVELMADTTTTKDFMLAGSHLTYSPEMIEEEMLTEEMVTHTIMLTNTGPLDIEFNLETDDFAAPASLPKLGGTEGGPEGMEIVNLTVEPLEAPAAPASLPKLGGTEGGPGSNLANLFAASNPSKFPLSQSWETRQRLGGEGQRVIELILDDGSTENGIGVGGKFVWLNRFTPAEFPFSLTEIEILFGNFGVEVGDLVDIYVYEDTDEDGDPGTNATHLASINDAEVQANDGSTWSVYELESPVMAGGPGDVLIAVVNRTAGINDGEFPAEIDQTASMMRSWTGIYTADPTDPPTFPADGTWGIIDDLAPTLAGNWMIRGYGQLGEVIPPWATVAPEDGVIPANSSVTIDVIFDSTGFTKTGTYSASLVFEGSYVNEVADMGLIMQLEYDDGIDDETEDGGPNDGDANGDGTPDSEQDNVASLPNAGDDEGYVTLEVPEDITLTEVEAISVPMTIPKGVAMPQGLFGFTLEGVEPAGGVTLTFYIENGDSAMDGYWKYDEMTDTWTDHSDYVRYDEAMVGDEMVTTIMLYLEDGGLGDFDGIANGTIVDPGAPTVSPTSISLAEFNSEASIISRASGEGWQLVALLALLLTVTMLRVTVTWARPKRPA